MVLNGSFSLSLIIGLLLVSNIQLQTNFAEITDIGQIIDMQSMYIRNIGSNLCLMFNSNGQTFKWVSCSNNRYLKFGIINHFGDTYGHIIAQFTYIPPFPLKCESQLVEHQAFDFIPVNLNTFMIRMLGTEYCLTYVSNEVACSSLFSLCNYTYSYQQFTFNL